MIRNGRRGPVCGLKTCGGMRDGAAEEALADWHSVFGPRTTQLSSSTATRPQPVLGVKIRIAKESPSRWNL